ncbi:MAG: VIT domain-containing protein [Planctomycetota bacterium]|jgi:Ca-activated chloride channel family protein
MSLASVTQPRTAPAARLVSVDGREFPLEAAAITARAEGGLAESRLVQTYSNPHAEPLEVLYTMPLPADGAVVGYTITLGDRVITGEIERLQEAREAYQRALEEGRTAGLLEQVRGDTFTQKLGSLPAGATAKVEIRVLHPLAFRPATDDGAASWEYRFPTVVGVRYQGAPGRVPDAADFELDRADESGTPVRLELDLMLADGAPEALDPQSPTHGIRVASADHGSRVKFDEGAPLDRDLVVSWRATTHEVGVRLIEGPGLPGDDGRYALLTVTPPTRPEATMPRDLTILIDASGSMMGQPLESAKDVVRALLGSLEPRDRFEMLAFADGVAELVKGPVAASPANVRRAMDRLDELQAGGCTEMGRAIIWSLKPLRPDAQRQVIMLTDGQVTFENEVIGAILQRLKAGCRIHAVGIGSAPNRSLTRGVARAGRGEELLVTDARDASASAGRLLRATVGPVLTDLAIGGTACRSVAPARSRDVLAGQPLVVAVELEPEGGTVEIRGRLAGSREDWVRTLDVSQPQSASPLPIGALFGREAVEDQETALAADPRAADSIENAIETLGLRHRITTRRTSLVAICEEPTVDPGAARRRHRLEVELPAGVSAEGVGLVPPAIHQLLASRMRIKQIPGMGGLRQDSVNEEFADLPSSCRFAATVHQQDEAFQRSRARRTPPATVVGRVVRVEDDLLVVEFEAPDDGFILPQGGEKIEVELDGRTFWAVVDGKVSTRPGPHDAGLTLRLGLRHENGAAWPDELLRARWSSPDGTEFLLAIRPRN